jgi:aquaporin Z
MDGAFPRAIHAVSDRAGGRAMTDTLKRHWPEYLMEAAELGAFMISALLFVALLQYPASPVRQAIPSDFARQALTGVAMGLTAIGIIYSPLGKRSGAHFNPSITLTFLRLGKVAPWDAVFYVLAQFAGGVAGVAIAGLLLGRIAAAPTVGYAVTTPGPWGVGAAFAAEVAISFLMMTMVLNVSNTPAIARYTGLIAGCLVATFITLESPLSGMSMNPARSLGSAVPAQVWTALWIYFTAPLIGMLAAAEVFLRRARPVCCAKLHHDNDHRCIFRCEYRKTVPRAACNVRR